MRRLFSRAFYRLFLISTCAGVMLLSAPRPHLAQQQAQASQAQSASDELMLTVTVANKRLGPVRGLSKSAFTITDDKEPREITSFSNEDVPHSVGIVFDMSGSLVGTEFTKRVMQSFDYFVNASNPSNEYFLMAFATRPAIIIDWTTQMSGVFPRLVVKKTGATALNDSLYLAIEKVKTGKFERRALIVITDGQDTVSQYTSREVGEFLKESDVMVYVIGGSSGSDPGAPPGMDYQERLKGFSSLTGGKLFVPAGPREMKDNFESIAAEMRSEYRIGFKLAAAAEKDQWRSVKVKVTPPPNAPKEMQSLIVRNRSGYYSHKRLR